MKKTFTLLLFALTTVTFAQETGKNIFERKYEIKVGAIKLLAGPILEGTFEYIQNKDFTYGVSLLGNLNTNNDYYEDFSVTPFARFYFQESKEYGAQGFFVEGFAKYSSGKNTANDDFNGSDPKYTAGALGISLGKKWINHTGFVFELLCGVGRTLGNSDAMPDVIFRGDLNIGYRF